MEERDYVQQRLKESRTVHCGSGLGFSVQYKVICFFFLDGRGTRTVIALEKLTRIKF